MPNVFLISDTHFSHSNICTFLRVDGTKLRPWTNPDEMDEHLIAQWNSVVQPGDKVYHLGDVVINRKALALVMPRLNGRKVLIKGNHDIFKLDDYTPHFYDIRAYHVLDKFLMSHIPVHVQNLGRFRGNVHGHMHDRVVQHETYKQCPDPRYFSVCVEQVNYTPVELTVLQQHFQQLAS